LFWLVVSNLWSTLLGWCYSFCYILMFLLFFTPPWSMLLFVLLLFASPWLMLLLLVKCAWHCCFSCYTLFDIATPLACSNTSLLHHDVVLLVTPCSLFNTTAPTPIVLNWYLPPIIFCKCGKSFPNSNF